MREKEEEHLLIGRSDTVLLLFFQNVFTMQFRTTSESDGHVWKNGEKKKKLNQLGESGPEFKRGCFQKLWERCQWDVLG